jgi:serine/threonine protein kinase
MSGEFLALKVFDDPLGKNACMTEANLLGRLKHPRIVEVKWAGKIGGHWVIAMEYLPAGSLREAIAQSGVPLPIHFVLHLGCEILEALQFAHEHGILHRDLKPANIMLTEDGGIKLSDFGMASLITPNSAPAVLEGTFPYMAPEVLDGESPCPASDIYSVATTLVHALTGMIPTLPNTERWIWLHTRLLHLYRPSNQDIPEDFEELLLDMLNPDPAARPSSAQELRQKMITMLSSRFSKLMGMINP